MMSVDSAFVLFVVGALVLSASTAFLNLNLPRRRRQRSMRASRNDDEATETPAPRRIVTGPPPALPATTPPDAPTSPLSGRRRRSSTTTSGGGRRHGRAADRPGRRSAGRRSPAEEHIELLVDTDPDRVAATITQMLRADDPPVRAPGSSSNPTTSEGTNR